MLSDWSTFSHDLLCFKKYNSCLPDFSSKSFLVILMFPLLIESLWSRGSIEISMMVALGHCFLAEIPDSIIPLTSCSRGSWSRCFFWKEWKYTKYYNHWKNLNFVFSITHVEFCPQVYQNWKCYDGKNDFSKFQSICLNWR